eukprot:1514060-Rhodomonas_salina.3
MCTQPRSLKTLCRGFASVICWNGAVASVEHVHKFLPSLPRSRSPTPCLNPRIVTAGSNTDLERPKAWAGSGERATATSADSHRLEWAALIFRTLEPSLTTPVVVLVVTPVVALAVRGRTSSGLTEVGYPGTRWGGGEVVRRQYRKLTGMQ